MDSWWVPLASSLGGVVLGGLTTLYAQQRQLVWSTRQTRQESTLRATRDALAKLLEQHLECEDAAVDLHASIQRSHGTPSPQEVHAFNLKLLRFAAVRAQVHDVQLRDLTATYIEALQRLVRSGDETEIQSAAFALQDRVSDLLIAANSG